MEIKILQVFYDKNGLPYKDKERTVHYPITSGTFLGASNTTQIRFYYDQLDELNESTFVAVSKLPNGKIGSEILESTFDEELNENYVTLSLSQFYTQYKGDVYISLQGYQGGVRVEQDENGIYQIYGTPTILATGSIKLSIAYAPTFIGSGQTENITLQRVLAELSTKLGIRQETLHVEELPEIGNSNVWYVVNDDPNDTTKANIYIWNATTQTYVWVGDNTLDLGDYYTREEGEHFESDIDNRVLSVENELSSVASGSPKGVYATLSDLESAYPTGTNGIYVVSVNGHWYYWNGSAWTDGGAYFSGPFDTSLNENSVNAVQNKVVAKVLNKLDNNYIVSAEKVVYPSISGTVTTHINFGNLKLIKGHNYIVRVKADEQVTGNFTFYIVKSDSSNLTYKAFTTLYTDYVTQFAFTPNIDDISTIQLWITSTSSVANISVEAYDLNGDYNTINGIKIPLYIGRATLNTGTLSFGTIDAKKGHKYRLTAYCSDNVSGSLLFFLYKVSGTNLAQRTLTALSTTEITVFDYIADKDDTLNLGEWNNNVIPTGKLITWSVYDLTLALPLETREFDTSGSKSTYYVAASDSSNADKLIADYVCDGVNDEVEINAAILRCDTCGTVFLLGGTYNIDAFNSYDGFEKTAIAITKTSLSYRSITIKGVRHYYKGTVISVSNSAFNSVGENEIPCVFNVLSKVNTDKTQPYWCVSIQDLEIALNEKYDRNCIAINLQNAGCGEIKNLWITSFSKNTYPEARPDGFTYASITAENLIGIRAFHGFTDGDTTRFDNISVFGFKYGFQLGGEHLICNNLRSRWCWCGYTFGQYHNSLTFGAFCHPITLINCCDEGSYQGPIFDWNGIIDTDQFGSETAKLQSITMIDFNIEPFVSPAYETTPGTFCGDITYHISDGVHGARVWGAFWANGSGHNFHSMNLAHAEGGTTAMRNTYAPNYMQKYYDTTLSKLLIYDGTNWVDANGNIV